MKISKLVPILGVCFLANVSYAQHAAKPNTASVSKGTVQLDNGTPTPVATSYLLDAVNPNLMNVHLLPSAPGKLNATIIDAKGNVVMTLPSENVTGRYIKQVDVSKLKAGKYTLRFNMDNNKPQDVSFSK